MSSEELRLYAKDEDDTTKRVMLEAAKYIDILEGIIQRNCDPLDATQADGEVIEEVMRRKQTYGRNTRT